ncbi:MAG: ABC transporter ATP-binding protein [Candidatus Promineifilaceae bacterium]|nr:ABC transporter ATP-binding protein [Candidatus Promineifilaceae bacterium]
MANVELNQISKRFGSVTALRDVSFEIEDGEFFVLLGPTGAGKTTTLRIISGLTRQDAGSVRFDGEAVDALTPADRDVAFVFQQYSLYPTMSVYDNLAFPLRSPLRNVEESAIKRKIEATAEILRISHLLERKTANLSGGEMQRVSIGRAIVREPRLFLMDEPLSNLDAKLRESLRVELQHIQKVQGSTTLFVTHDQVEALTMADRIAVLDHGRIVQIGSPRDIYDRPATVFVAQLVGTPRINLLEARRDNGALRVKDSPIAVPADQPKQSLPDNLLIGVRPEDVVLNQEGEFAAEVALIEPLGVETVLHLRAESRTLLSTSSGMTQFKLGEQVRFNIDPDRLHYFDQEGDRL